MVAITTTATTTATATTTSMAAAATCDNISHKHEPCYFLFGSSLESNGLEIPVGAFELEAAIFQSPGIIFADFLARVNIHFGAQTTLAAFAPVVDIVIVVVVVVVVIGTKNERNENGPVMK